MDLYDKINLLQNRQNQLSNESNLEQLKANEAELKKLRQQLKQEAERQANKPKCPHCGGGTEKGYDVCKNCGRPVVWRGRFVGKPGEEAILQQRDDEWKQKERAKHQRNTEKKQRKREARRLKQIEDKEKAKYDWLWGIGFILGIPIVLVIIFVGTWYGLSWLFNYPGAGLF